MKFKSKKLTALAMAVLMAASTMSSAVFAEDVGEVEVVADTPVVIDEVQPSYIYDETDSRCTIVFHYNETGYSNGEVTWIEVMTAADEADPRFSDVTKYPRTRERHDIATSSETRKGSCNGQEDRWFNNVEKDGDPHAPGIQYFYTLNNVTHSSGWFDTGKVPAHNWVAGDTWIETYPSCNGTAGEGYTEYTCSECGAKKTVDISDKLEAPDHKYEPFVLYEAGPDDNIQLDNKGNVILGEDGLPMLKDEKYDGHYTVTTGKSCTVCGHKEIDKVEQKTIYSKWGWQAKIKNVKNIPATKADGTANAVVEDANYTGSIDANTVELTDCTKDGTYEVWYYNKSDTFMSKSDTFTVPAHHMFDAGYIEFATEKEMNQCLNTSKSALVMKDGKVVNQSCYLPVTYKVVKHCTAKNCKATACEKGTDKNDNKNAAYYVFTLDGKKVLDTTIHAKYHETVESVVVEPTGDHLINTDTKKEVAATVGKDKTITLTREQVADIEAMAASTTKTPHKCDTTVIDKAQVEHNITVKDTATCTEDGELIVEYECKICGKDNVYTETYKSKAKGHDLDEAVPERVTIKPATCEENGIYDAIIKCKRCGEVIEKKEGLIIPRLAHTNELKDDRTGNPIGDDTFNTRKQTVNFGVVGNVVVDDNEYYWKAFQKNGSVDVPAGNVDEDGNLVVGVKSLSTYHVRPDAYTLCTTCKGDPHKVSLEKVTKSVKITNIKKEGNRCQAGSITLVVTYEYTDNDGKAAKYVADPQTFEYYSSLAAYAGGVVANHEAGKPEIIERVEPTETEDGYYIEVIRCVICNTELSREKHIIPALGVKPEKLPAVTGVKLEAIGAGRVNVSWNEVEGADYYVVLLHDSFEYKGVAKSVSAPKLSTSITGLDTEVFSHIWVAAVKKGVNGGKDVVGDAGQYQSILAREVPTVTGLKASAEAGKITLTWKAQSRANTYSVAWKSTADDTVHQVVVGDETTYTLENTTKNVGYYFWVYAGYTNSRTNKNGEPIGETTSAGRAFAGIVAK